MRIEDLSQLGYVRVAYPEALRKLVERAMLGWQTFCALPQSEKKRCSKEGDRDADFGYMMRSDHDQKEQFHVSLKDTFELKQRSCCIRDPHAVEFVIATDMLIYRIQPLIAEFAEHVERVYGVVGLKSDVLESAADWTFRYLHYYGTEHLLADEHIDRGGFTLHLYENEPGGEYLDFDFVWRPFPIDHAQTVIFPSLGLQHRSQSALKALWHRVLATPETAQNGRFALVVFIDFPGFRCQNIRKQFGNRPAGFNYHLDADAFEAVCAQ